MASFFTQNNKFHSFFLFLLLLIFTYLFSSSAHSLARTQAEELIKSLNLSPKHHVATLNANATNSETESEFVEKKFKFPSFDAKDLGHHAGYIKLPHSKAARMFYYFFESRNNKSDPVVIWLTGGPGCSGSLALFYENGPFRFSNNISLVWNDYGWDQASNIIFIDQPVGTGFSHTNETSDYCRSEDCVSNDLYDFLQVFFKNHTEFVNNELYVTGESYAGHYAPALTSRIIKGNKANEGIHINIKGMAIGNGLTNPRIQYPAYVDYALNMKLINQTDYDSIMKQVPYCVRTTKACESGGEDECNYAYKICGGISVSIMNITGNINKYDIRKQCVGELCYDFSALETLFRDSAVKEALGVGHIMWDSCSLYVYTAMEGDLMKNLDVGIPELLEEGIKVLLYAGEYDFICNWLGNSLWINAMNWSGQKEFVAAPNVSFIVDGKEAGTLKSHGLLNFLKVHNSGHMVPMDQPNTALQMIKSWMQGKLSL